MASFIYFLPGVEGSAESRLSALGFSHVMERGAPSVSEQNGPKGEGFLVVPASKDPAAPIYAPEQQTWKPAKGGAIWIGYQNDKPPTPEDLERTKTSSAYIVPLADGNNWRIPEARLFPAILELNEAGDDLIRRYTDDYVAMSREAEALLERSRAEGGVLWMNEIERFDLAARILGVNYAVSRWEVSALGLLMAGHAVNLIHALLGFEEFEKVADGLEKNEPGPSTPSGSDSACGVEG